ncbi:MAG: SDR family oxidoreductase, partial [Lachnospiraceae bacterium]|nr:SDR family oxidoreductase [Lachnospiraceae bacterium]
RELASRNICVNAVAPGFIQTEMTDVLSESVQDNLKKMIPLGKMGSPEDVANMVLFLAGENSDYITGQVIHVDGGMVM